MCQSCDELACLRSTTLVFVCYLYFLQLLCFLTVLIACSTSISFAGVSAFTCVFSLCASQPFFMSQLLFIFLDLASLMDIACSFTDLFACLDCLSYFWTEPARQSINFCTFTSSASVVWIWVIFLMWIVTLLELWHMKIFIIEDLVYPWSPPNYASHDSITSFLFCYHPGPRIWNTLPSEIRTLTDTEACQN